MKISIIGGGIGGLVTALKLNELGHEIKIFEAVKEIKPLGVGINILPHSVRILKNLGLEPIIANNAIETSQLVYYNKFGQKFWAEPRGKFAGYKWSQYSIHRGDLQMLLFNEVIKKIGKKSIILNAHFSYFEESNNKIKAFFKSEEKTESYESDLLIGADGINSAMRKQLFPAEGPPIFSENVLYRGTSIMKPFLDGASMAMIGSLKQKMVVYPIQKVTDDGLSLINWVGNIKEGGNMLTIRDWNKKTDKNRLIDLYKNWTFDWLNVPEMINKSETVYEFPMSDRNPLDRWSFGRVSLLGDAAHPMYPIGSNGASQAILDAEALAEHLKNTEDPVDALQAYDADRRPATSKIVLQNRAKGPDEIMDLMEDWFPTGFTKKEIPHNKLEVVMDNYKRIAGFDIETLNLKN